MNVAWKYTERKQKNGKTWRIGNKDFSTIFRAPSLPCLLEKKRGLSVLEDFECEGVCGVLMDENHYCYILLFFWQCMSRKITWWLWRTHNFNTISALLDFWRLSIMRVFKNKSVSDYTTKLFIALLSTINTFLGTMHHCSMSIPSSITYSFCMIFGITHYKGFEKKKFI